MITVYVVMSSNCEEWEDYWEHIDSIWSTKAAAVRHIENDLGMVRDDTRGRNRSVGSEHWSTEVCDRLQPSDCTDYIEYAELVEDNDGEPPIVWSQKCDAWIVEYGVSE